MTLHALIVNSPQVLISFFHMAYNGLLTCILLSADATEISACFRPHKACNALPTGCSFHIAMPYLCSLLWESSTSLLRKACSLRAVRLCSAS